MDGLDDKIAAAVNSASIGASNMIYAMAATKEQFTWRELEDLASRVQRKIIEDFTGYMSAAA